MPRAKPRKNLSAPAQLRRKKTIRSCGSRRQPQRATDMPTRMARTERRRLLRSLFRQNGTDRMDDTATIRDKACRAIQQLHLSCEVSPKTRLIQRPLGFRIAPPRAAAGTRGIDEDEIRPACSKLDKPLAVGIAGNRDDGGA